MSAVRDMVAYRLDTEWAAAVDLVSTNVLTNPLHTAVVAQRHIRNEGFCTQCSPYMSSFCVFGLLVKEAVVKLRDENLLLVPDKTCPDPWPHEEHPWIHDEFAGGKHLVFWHLCSGRSGR